ncbi:type VI secretion system protein TssA [Massilia sp. UYP11]|uniref:type VI secretion system protein TssA n=1 Tax=Massilia sp. UYP11 TaxID=1756385 RepID=UPI003D20DF18
MDCSTRERNNRVRRSNAHALMTDTDVSPPLALLSAEQRDELESLLQPISEYYPSGPPIRFDPIYTEIRLAREEDDPILPMGGSERLLKRADWARIEARCKVTLREHAKDLQIAAWMTEACTHQQGMEGLLRGLLLVDGLLAHYWETVHPQVDEDGDPALRVAPLEWMNRSLSTTTRMKIPLLGRTGGPLDRLTLADWERLSGDEASPARKDDRRGPGEESGEALHTRAGVVDYATANRGADADRSAQLVRACLAVMASIERLTVARLGDDAPDMSTLRDTLRAMERAARELTAPREGDVARQPVAAPMMQGVSHETAQPKEENTGGAGERDIPPYGLAQADVADQLRRRIDALCAAAGIHAPSGAERLMAMQIALLLDQNTILQGLARNQAGQTGSAASADAADFTALVRAVLAAKAPAPR